MNNLYLKSFIRCKRKAWLDFKGNKSFKIWSPHKAIEIINHFKTFNEFSKGDLYSGLKACEKGYKGVIGLKIKKNLYQNINAEILPQLLVKTIGKSKWGNYKYIPAVYKLGHRTTREHLFDLAFCSILLETFQGSKIDKGLVISNFAGKINIEEIYLNKKLKKKVFDVFLSLNQSLGGLIPEITEDRKKCTICPWQNFCDKEAKDNGFLTDIDGIGSKTNLLLKSNGISNIKELASCRTKDLGDKLFKFNNQKYEKASKIIKQAKSYISGKPISIFDNVFLSQLISKKTSGFFVFDIESNPDEKHNFLYGFLEINNLSEKIKNSLYEPILNINKLKNKRSYQTIMLKLFLKKDWQIIHYGDTEKIAIMYLAKKLNYSIEEINMLESRFIDLHQLIRKTWILPIKNYSLKTVANWIGFNWTQPKVSGSKALYWWHQYQITNNDIFLKKIIQYNRDDCLATLHIAKWLITNKIKQN